MIAGIMHSMRLEYPWLSGAYGGIHIIFLNTLLSLLKSGFKLKDHMI